MRIVAGTYSSRRIETPKGTNTRPTLDKVRGAVFSSLGGMFDGGSVLDLYAGSGANAFEALSRGMDEAVLVDISREAVRLIRQNAENLGCEDRCRILPVRDMKALHMLAAEGRTFDLVYLDPPYAKETNYAVMQFLDEHQMVNKGGTVVIESSADDRFDKEVGSLKPLKDVKYGITRITYYRNTEQDG